VIRLSVHVHPGSSRPRVGGSYDGALVVRVRARAVGGAATDEVLAALASAFGVRPRSVTCVRGAHSRTKAIVIEGDADALEQRRRVLIDSDVDVADQH